MYAHPQDKNVVLIIAILFLMSFCIDSIYTALILRGMVDEKISSFLYFADISLMALCAIITFTLYNDLLKKDLPKTWKTRYRLILITFVDILISQFLLMQDNKSISFSIDDSSNISLNSNVTITLRLFRLIIIMPFMEEIIFRRFLYQLVKEEKRLLKAIKNTRYNDIMYLVLIIIINSVLFSILHYDNRCGNFFYWKFLYFAFGGMNLCFCCEVCDSITSSIFMHIFYNFFVLCKMVWSSSN